MKLFSRTYGDKGKDLIILHGLFGMSDNWNSLAKRFSIFFRVHLLDLRNHGRSPHSKEFNYDVLSEDIVEYIKDSNISSSIILGHSLGGKVAMRTAFLYPEYISKIIVADIAPREYNTEYHKNLLIILDKLNIQEFNKRDEVDKALSSYLDKPSIRFFLLKNLYRKGSNSFSWRFNIKTLLEKIDNIKEAVLVKEICSTPAYFIKAGNSNYITQDDELKIKYHFPNSKIKTINNVGHWLHAEDPESFYQEVLGI